MTVAYLATDRGHGDLALRVEPADLAARRAAIIDAPWTWLRQVHGAGVVTVRHPGEHAGAEADAAVTVAPGAPIAVQTADCAPILLVADGGVGVVHAGWRGLVEGVIEAAADALVTAGAPPYAAVLGPCIRARCYEFGRADLARVAERYGPTVHARTGWGTPALDVSAGVRTACERLGLTFTDCGICTACSPDHWSYRARADASRQALVAWLEP
ncbi:polyphenol oxidase family protein [Aquihabitans sp. G128]|uniref:polyphenol oxidase family protein n=1 Tax=Aquihabitans sp. G128 TaxID=2849779 RepID=UPI001C216006|nr:polyphenol oxidase family protein [Aquihabitans sp. G128]QXC62266.1 polyphenol oxidase family protein [Aquihabitans sp. G128]